MTDTTNKTPAEVLAPDVVTPEVVPAPGAQAGQAGQSVVRRLEGVAAQAGFHHLGAARDPHGGHGRRSPHCSPRSTPGIAASSTPSRPPSSEHRFGTDLQGCDYYARTIHGARTSVSIGLVVTFFSTIIAVALGSLSGYKGGWLDSSLSRFTDIMFAIPLILGALVFLNALAAARGVLQVSAVLIAFGWPTMMRLMRSSVLVGQRARLHRRRPCPGCQRLADHHPSRPRQRDHTCHRLCHHHRRGHHLGRGLSVLPQCGSPAARHLVGPDDQHGTEPHPCFPAPVVLPRAISQRDRLRIHPDG